MSIKFNYYVLDKNQFTKLYFTFIDFNFFFFKFENRLFDDFCLMNNINFVFIHFFSLTLFFEHHDKSDDANIKGCALSAENDFLELTKSVIKAVAKTIGINIDKFICMFEPNLIDKCGQIFYQMIYNRNLISLVSVLFYLFNMFYHLGSHVFVLHYRRVKHKFERSLLADLRESVKETTKELN